MTKSQENSTGPQITDHDNTLFQGTAPLHTCQVLHNFPLFFMTADEQRKSHGFLNSVSNLFYV